MDQKKQIPINVNLNDNAKTAVVAVAISIVFVAFVKLVHFVGGFNAKD